MRKFSYHSAGSLAEGIRHLDSDPADSVRLLAGGTDLLPLMKSGIEQPDTLIGIRRIPELTTEVTIDETGARLGALTTLGDIAEHPDLARRYPALAQAAAQAASPQLRNMATLGGTLLQRPRCWYFRDPAFRCWLKGGSVCHARDGMNQGHAIFDTGECRAAHPSDLACALSALDASVDLRGPQGTRSLQIADFLQPPTDQRRRETVLAADEFVVSVRVPTAERLGRSIFLKAMERNAWSFATVSVAARIRHRGEVIEAVDVVLGAVATIPWSIGPRLDEMCNRGYDDQRMVATVRAAFDDAEPLAMNAYKVPLARALTERALRELAADR